jgi:N-acetylglutamate synthase-like GNAT family acetyltransferase
MDARPASAVHVVAHWYKNREWWLFVREFMMLLRDGQEPDRPAIGELLANYQMEADLDPVEFLVAEVDGVLVGAARLEWAGQAAYLRPVVVAPGWHGKGIGRALVRELLQKSPRMRVVSRGSVTGFYEGLGFWKVGWEQIYPAFVSECQGCQDNHSCQPVPMAAELSSQSVDQGKASQLC